MARDWREYLRAQEIKTVPIEDIKPYPNNPRDNEKAVPAVAASIERFGFRNPILVDADGVIIEGHTRRLVALKLGMKEVPVVYATDLTPDEVATLRVIDNKTAEQFMESLAKDAPRKVFLVMDNLKVRHCKPVKEWQEKNKERIEVFYLPSYSPELNPDERLNADLKHAITTSVPRRTRQGLLKKTTEHMNMVKSSPERVKTYFKDKHVAYAAEST